MSEHVHEWVLQEHYEIAIDNRNAPLLPLSKSPRTVIQRYRCLCNEIKEHEENIIPKRKKHGKA